MKIDRKIIFDVLYKNRYLILLCAVLNFGTFLGTSMVKFLPENICKNLYEFLSRDTTEFFQLFLNKFCFPFIIFLMIFLCGFSIIGSISVPAVVFINGAFYGFENAVMFSFEGKNYILQSMVSYFTATLFIGFLLILLSESSVFFSKSISTQFKGKTEEKPYYNAKNQCVKFITFTVFIALFSAFYAYISPIIQSLVPVSF